MPVDFSRFAAVLRDLGVAGEVRELPESAPTAAAAAAQLGCELGAIANSLVFSADGAPLLVMTSGAHRVDTARVAGLLGVSAVRRADARSVREWTGQAIGGVASVGHPSPIRTLVDTRLGESVVLLHVVVTRSAAYGPHRGTVLGELIAAVSLCARLVCWSALRVWRLSPGHQARDASSPFCVRRIPLGPCAH